MTTVFARVRDQRYTGSNRCWKCTVLNVGGAALAGGLIAVVNPWIGGVVLGGALLTIYLRGYLIPGTPRLTKRYFPAGLLRWFGHDPEPETSIDGGPAIERLLLDAEVLHRAEEELYLDSTFRKRWRDNVQDLRGADEATVLPQIGGLSAEVTEKVSVTEVGDALLADVDGIRLARWDSTGAFLADVAAARELEARLSSWSTFTFDERTQVLGALRLWLDWCPLCDGRVVLQPDTVETCCSEIDVVAGICEDCGRRLFELDAPEPVPA